MSDEHGVLQIECCHQLGQIIGIGIHIIALPGLAGPSMASAIRRDTAIAFAGQEEHLIFEGIRVQAISMIETMGGPVPQSLK